MPSRAMSRYSPSQSRSYSGSLKRRRSASRSSRSTRLRPGWKLRLSKGRIGNSVNMHRYVRWVTTPVDLSCTAVENTYASVYQLADLQNYTELQALYDRYMITMVEMRIHLITNPDSNSTLNSTLVSQQTNWYPKLWYCKDYDDSFTEGLDALKQRAKTKCIVLKPDRIYKIRIKPAVSIQTYKTATTSGYAPAWNQWIDNGDSTVPHYGLKYVVDTEGENPNDSYPFKIRIEHRYWVTMKDVR